MFLVGWLLVGFLPAAFTTHPPFDRRMLVSVFPFLLFSALGIIRLIAVRKKNHWFRLIPVALYATIVFSHTMYIHQYFGHGQEEVVPLWGNGIRSLVTTVRSMSASYRQVVVSMRLDQPLTFFLFYEQYPPDRFLSEGGRISGGYLDERNRYDRYQFKMIRPEDIDTETLYVWSAAEQ